MSEFKEVKGVRFENKNYDIEIKYSPDSIQQELIKVIPKEGEIVFSADDIIRLIAENFRNKDLAYALSTTDTSFVPSIEVAIPIYFKSNKDIKEGEDVQFFAPFNMPIGIALAMEAHRLCIDKKLDVEMIPREQFDEAAKQLKDNSMKFVEEYWKPQIEAVKKKIAADTGKAVN